jgi:preprotein translocase SecE subunit
LGESVGTRRVASAQFIAQEGDVRAIHRPNQLSLEEPIYCQDRNKDMADRKKHSNRSRTAALNAQRRKQAQIVKNVKAPTSDDQGPASTTGVRTQDREERQEAKPVKESTAQASEKQPESVPTKQTKVLASQELQEVLPVANGAKVRGERRRPQRQEAKAASRRESKGIPRWRTTAAGRFIYDAYYELRYKVTWPTLKEAKNMTMVVVALSAIVGSVIALADYGLHELFIFLVTKSWSP